MSNKQQIGYGKRNRSPTDDDMLSSMMSGVKLARRAGPVAQLHDSLSQQVTGTRKRTQPNRLTYVPKHAVKYPTQRRYVSKEERKQFNQQKDELFQLFSLMSIKPHSPAAKSSSPPKSPSPRSSPAAKSPSPRSSPAAKSGPTKRPDLERYRPRDRFM